MASANITHSQLLELLSYDENSGQFQWLKSQGRTSAGSRAGTIHSLGYRIIGIDGSLYRANRLAWFYVTKEWPAGVVDHINRDKSDDRFANLRDVSHRTNCINRGCQKNNTSGITGVRFEKQSGKWFAYIKAHGKMRSLGRFDTMDLAIIARRVAEQSYGYGSPSGVEV